jgi:hypothetical protein
MSEYETYYREVCTSHAWADHDADDCGCKGRGWWLSEIDTWHACPFHGKGVPHPEYPESEDLEAAPDWVPPPLVEVSQDDDILF